MSQEPKMLLCRHCGELYADDGEGPVSVCPECLEMMTTVRWRRCCSCGELFEGVGEFCDGCRDAYLEDEARLELDALRGRIYECFRLVEDCPDDELVSEFERLMSAYKAMQKVADELRRESKGSEN